MWEQYANETNPLLRERFFTRVTEMYGYQVLLQICGHAACQQSSDPIARMPTNAGAKRREK